MGRHKKPTELETRTAWLRNAIDRLYDAALSPLPEGNKCTIKACQSWHDSLRDAYGYGNGHDGYGALDLQPGTVPGPGLLGAIMGDPLPTIRSKGTPFQVGWACFVGDVPDEFRFPEGKEWADVTPHFAGGRMTGNEFVRGAPVLQEGYRMRFVPGDSITTKALDNLVESLRDMFLLPERFQALRFVAWASEALSRFETAYYPEIEIRKIGTNCAVKTVYASVVRQRQVTGERADFLWSLAKRGWANVTTTIKHDLVQAVPELHPFIIAPNASQRKRGSHKTQSDPIKYCLDPAMKARLTAVGPKKLPK